MIKAVLFSIVKNRNQSIRLSQVNLTASYVWCIHVSCCAVYTGAMLCGAQSLSCV